MGLFDRFKKKTPEEIRGYQIHSLQFCEVGKDGKRDTAPGTRFFTDSRYLMPVVRLTALRPGTVTIKVRIFEPDGKSHEYSFEAPLTKDFDNRECFFPWWGSEAGKSFQKPGRWAWQILDSEDNMIISQWVTITPLEALWEENGWIHVESQPEFADTDGSGSLRTPWGYGPLTEPYWLKMRFRYSSYTKTPREICYKSVIIHHKSGKRIEFDHTYTIQPGRGELELCGYGSGSGNFYAPGQYTYKIEYQGREIYKTIFEVAPGPAEKGYIEPLELVFFAFDTDDELQKWLVYNCAMSVAKGQALTQEPLARGRKRLTAAFHWKGLKDVEDVKLRFVMYVDGQKGFESTQTVRVYDSASFETDKNIMTQNLEAGAAIRFTGSTGETIPLPSARYGCKVYVTGGAARDLLVAEKYIQL